MAANEKITDMDTADPIVGDEKVEVVQNGDNKQSTPLAITAAVNESLEGRLERLNLIFVSVSSVDVSTGFARDTTNVKQIKLTSTKTADITVSGAGGLDTGGEAADTWYAVHVIGDSTGVNAPDVLLSVSDTAPTLPGTHDIFRHVGWIRNNGSNNFLKFTQSGVGRTKEYQYDESRADLNILSGGTAIAFATISAAAFVPPTSNFCVIGVDWDPKSTGDEFVLRPSDHTTTLANYPWRFRSEVKSSTDWRDQIEMFLDSSQQFDYAITDVLGSLGASIIWFEDQI